MTDHRQDAVFGAATMDIAIASAHGPERRTEISADRIQYGLAKSEPAGSVADQRRKNVAFAQSQADRNTKSFLSAAEEYPSGDLSRAEEAGEFVVENPG